MGEVTVGIDIGTTSVKAVAVDDTGQVLSRSRIRNRLNVPSPTRFEHNAGQAWRRNVRRAWREVAVGHEVAAASVVGIVPTLCAVDRRGVPLTPGLLYGDERGQSPAPTEWEGFLSWAAATAPAAAGLWPAQAVANAALLGDGSVGYIDTTAALTAYPVFSGREWDDERVAATGAFRRQMPAVVAGHGPVGEFDGTLLGPGGVDAFAEQLVAGADQPGDVLVICGTTLIVWVVGAGLLSAPGLFTVPHSTPGLDLMGGPSDAGGLFIGWVDRLVAGGGGGDDVHDPDAVPVWAPFPRGERVPFHDPHRRADYEPPPDKPSPAAGSNQRKGKRR